MASLPDRFRRALAELIGPAKAAEAEKVVRQSGIKPNEFNRAMATAWNFYEGLRQTRERTRIAHILTDADATNTSWARREHMSVARHLYANDGLVRGLINDCARYTVGTGLRPQAQTRDAAWNEAAEAYWDDWCFRADFLRRSHFDRLQSIWQIGEMRDGDIGIALVRGDQGEPQVQTLKGHRIGNYGDDTAGMVDGVRLDPLGRPVAYRVQAGESYRDLPANSFILFHEPQESDATRGITALHHAINHVRDKKDTVGFEKIAIKNLSAFTAVLKTQTGTVAEPDWNEDGVTTAEPTNITLAQMQSGQLPVIGKDEEIQAFESDRPSPAFMGFLEFLIREISVGLGIPYEFAWNAEKIGGAVVRFTLEKADRRFTERRKLFVNSVLARIWGYVISDAIQRGRLPENPQKFLVDWQAPAALTVDAGRDGNSDRADVLMGLMPESDHYAMRGLDRQKKRNLIEQEANDLLERAKRLSAAHGISLELAIQLLRQTSTSQASTAFSPPVPNQNAGRPPAP